MKGFTVNGLGVLGIVLGLFGIGYSVYKEKKTEELAKKLDLSVEDVANKTPVQVQQSLIDKAVDIAVDRAVDNMARSAVADVKSDFHLEIEKQVGKAVTEVTAMIRGKVSDEAKDQLDHIDKDMIVKDATRKIVDELRIEGRKELNHQMTGVVNELSSNLAAYKQVYDGVKGALNFVNPANTGKDVTFRIN